MIQDVDNVELFELFETDPMTQCTECLSYWSEGIVYCTCGHLLKQIVANRGFIEYTLELLSIPDVIKNGRLHGHRYGKTPEKKEYHLAHFQPVAACHTWVSLAIAADAENWSWYAMDMDPERELSQLPLPEHRRHRRHNAGS